MTLAEANIVSTEISRERFWDCSRRLLHPVPPGRPKAQLGTFNGSSLERGAKVLLFLNFGDTATILMPEKRSVEPKFTSAAEI